MEETLREYEKRIELNEINIHQKMPDHCNGLVIDPEDPQTAVNCLGFGCYHLVQGQPIQLFSGDKEYAFVPMEGFTEIHAAGKTYKMDRRGGVFESLPSASNASAVYIPRDTEYVLNGQGEVVFYCVKASNANLIPFMVNARNMRMESYGAGLWRRGLVFLITPEKGSSNLIVGETYSPPGHWSGTPLHVHDKDDIEHGQSDHEEIYYHRFRTPEYPLFPPYGVQLLFNGKTLNKAYLIQDRSIITVPGACHPVVNGPVADHLYVFGLGGTSQELKMADIPAFKYLRTIESILKELESKSPVRTISIDNLRKLGSEQLSLYERTILNIILQERGFVLIP